MGDDDFEDNALRDAYNEEWLRYARNIKSNFIDLTAYTYFIDNL